MAAEVTYNSAWYTLGGAIAKKNVTTKSYTPFGEQIGEQTSGFGFNGEYYSAATGQIYLRARFYEPEMARFVQKDIVRGTITDALSLNRYSYCENDPINFCDPSGMRAVVDIDAASVASKPKTTTSKAVTKPVQSHTSSVNPNNTAKVTSQAVADAKAAMDFANRTAPNSLQAQQARDAYQRTVNNAAIANATNNPSAAMKAVQTSKQAVNYANSSVNSTGKPKKTTTSSSSSTSGNSYTPTTSSPTVQSPVPEIGNCGAYGKGMLLLGKDFYSIFVPDSNNLNSDGWKTVSEEKIKSKPEFNFFKFLLSDLSDANGSSVYAGYNMVSDGYVTDPVGLAVLGGINFLNGASNSTSTKYVKLILQENSGDKRAIVMAGSSDIYSLCNQYADGYSRALSSLFDSPISKQMVSDGAARLYRLETGLLGAGSDQTVYDINFTIDPAHNNGGYSSYLWVDNGEIMGAPILFPDDSLSVARLGGFLNLRTEYEASVELSGDSLPMDEYYEIMAQFVYMGG